MEMLELQKKILTDAGERKAFAADPRGYLAKAGVAIPEGVQLPPSLPLQEFEAHIADVESRLSKRGINLKQFSPDAFAKGGLVNAPELAKLEKGQPHAETAGAVVVVVVAGAAWTWVIL